MTRTHNPSILFGGVERDRTRFESRPTVGLSVRPLSFLDCELEKLQYPFCLLF